MSGPEEGVPTTRRAAVARLVAGGAALAAGAAVAPARADALRSPGRFAGKAVLITGATSGIGQTTAEHFAQEGARVVFCGRREALGRAVEAGIRRAGGDATYVRADVREPDQVRALVDACVARHGRVDVAFNNAGIFMTPHEVQDADVDNFFDILRTDAGGVFLAMKYEVPAMRAQAADAAGARGVIINTASIAGHKGNPITPAYCAAKHAIVGLTKCAALANARRGIRVVSLSPFAVDTPQLRESLAYQHIPYARVAAEAVTPRVMTTDEMARAVLFLASPDASSLAGTDLDVTGGQLA